VECGSETTRMSWSRLQNRWVSAQHGSARCASDALPTSFASRRAVAQNKSFSQANPRLLSGGMACRSCVRRPTIRPRTCKATRACRSRAARQWGSHGCGAAAQRPARPAASPPPPPQHPTAALAQSASAPLPHARRLRRQRHGPPQELLRRALFLDPAHVAAVLMLATVQMQTGEADEVKLPPPSRTKWTRRVPHPVLIGHAAPLPPY